MEPALRLAISAIDARHQAERRDVVLPPFQYFLQQTLLIHPFTAPIWITGLIAFFLSPRLKIYRPLAWSYLVSYSVFFVLHGKNYYLAPIYPMLLAAGAVMIEAGTNRPFGRWMRPATVVLLLSGGAYFAPVVVPILSPDRFIAYKKYGLRAVEVTLNLFERLQHLLQLLRLIDLPILLWSKADARAVCAATLVGSTVGGCRRPSGRYEFRNRQPRGQDLLLERGDIFVIDQHMIDCRDGILPEEFFLRNLRTEVARAGSHVAMR
jgi:hypothetical protein